MKKNWLQILNQGSIFFVCLVIVDCLRGILLIKGNGNIETLLGIKLSLIKTANQSSFNLSGTWTIVIYYGLCLGLVWLVTTIKSPKRG